MKMTQAEATEILRDYLGDGHKIREDGDSEFYFIFRVDGEENGMLVRKEDGEVLPPNLN